MKKVLLFDIEGTTTDIAFVHKVLFPYSLERIEGFVRAHSQHPAVEGVRQVLQAEQGVHASLSDVIEALKLWIRTDRKEANLKKLQGEIWIEGYQSGAFRGHVYPEVKEKWQEWKALGYELAIYSSGSVPAQKLIFGFSLAGDLTPMISAYFDTSVGHKREVRSYRNIVEALKTSPQDVTFFSDIAEELDAARAAGLATVQVFREGLAPSKHRAITSFEEVTL